ncbi:unnamed protein product [Protopolystoma xenopodis]|uniref:Uncharacterized protein n=1 Tax=Protopolystoma xenopodis TaxID=117903 RepID=A0A3S5CNU1_9PLAT|nr:unnamed protein product [Protopolystoma xenopodis]
MPTTRTLKLETESSSPQAPPCLRTNTSSSPCIYPPSSLSFSNLRPTPFPIQALTGLTAPSSPDAFCHRTTMDNFPAAADFPPRFDSHKGQYSRPNGQPHRSPGCLSSLQLSHLSASQSHLTVLAAAYAEASTGLSTLQTFLPPIASPKSRAADSLSAGPQQTSLITLVSTRQPISPCGCSSSSINTEPHIPVISQVATYSYFPSHASSSSSSSNSSSSPMSASKACYSGAGCFGPGDTPQADESICESLLTSWRMREEGSWTKEKRGASGHQSSLTLGSGSTAEPIDHLYTMQETYFSS